MWLTQRDNGLLLAARVSLEGAVLILNWKTGILVLEISLRELVNGHLAPDTALPSVSMEGVGGGGGRSAWLGDFGSVQLPCPGAPARYHGFPRAMLWFDLMLYLAEDSFFSFSFPHPLPFDSHQLVFCICGSISFCCYCCLFIYSFFKRFHK